MANGRPGDHPLTDILNHRILTFSERADELIRQRAELVLRQDLGSYVNWKSPPPIEEFEAQLEATLKRLRDAQQ